MLISPIQNTNYSDYKNYNLVGRKTDLRNTSTSFNGINGTLEHLSPLKYCMRGILGRFTNISKVRKFNIDKDFINSLKIVSIKTGKGTSQAWDINPNNSKKYIIFYHGIGQNITSNQELYKTMIKKGYGVFAPEYGGFGESSGTVTASSIRQNTIGAIKYLIDKGIKRDDIGVVGFSLGSYPAVTLAHNNKDLKFLVLISPFNSLQNETQVLLKGSTVKLPKAFKYLIEKFPPLIKTLDWSFQTLKKVKSLKLPVYFIHSENDKIISTSSTQELANCSRNLKELVILKTGGHSIDPEKINAFSKLNGI